MRIISKDTDLRSVLVEGDERIIELVGPDVDLGGVLNHSIIRLELAPGVCSPQSPHMHKKSEETYVVLSGSAEIMIDGNRARMETGDIAVAAIGESHQIKAVGELPLIALAIMAPGFDISDVYLCDE